MKRSGTRERFASAAFRAKRDARQASRLPLRCFHILKRRPFHLCALGLALVATRAFAAPTELFVLWQGRGDWRCTLTIDAGTIRRAEPYMFLDAHDHIERSEAQRVQCVTTSRGNGAGLHLFVEAEPNCALRLETNRATERFALADLPAHDAKIVRVVDGSGFLLCGRGDPAVGPQDYYHAHLPSTFVTPVPRDAVELAGDSEHAPSPVRITFADSPPGDVRVRRVEHGEGKLFLEVFSPAGGLKGKVTIQREDQPARSVALDGSLWLSLAPRIGRIALTVSSPRGKQELSVPTTLVEVRGTRIFLNGEPFLIKGTLPGDMSREDAAFIRMLGMNTLRGGEAPTLAERDGFMAIASIQGASLKKLSDYRGERGRTDFERDLPRYYEAKTANGRAAADNPYTLIIQLDNERTESGANPVEPDGTNVGADPWSDFVKGDDSEFVRLNRILAEDWNRVKPMAPMLPLGYANETQGYLAPAFLDLYMHNSYYPRDRYGIPFKDFSRLQGGEHRPFVNTEWGANRFTTDSYLGAKNTPLLEKLQAWGYRQLWNTFMAAGTVGGTSYRLYDGTGGSTQEGARNFGIMTADRQPKLASWEVRQMWRDFEIAPPKDDTRSLVVSFKREYAARHVRLTVQRDGESDWSGALEDFGPSSHRGVTPPFAAGEFSWKIDYETHHGLKMSATGAWPAAREEAEFARRFARRDAPDFLRELMTARVLTAQGNDAPPALVDMMISDGVIPIAFQCADGTVYVTAFTRQRLHGTHYLKADITTSFHGDVVKVDEWTGKPLAADVPHEVDANGIVFRAVDIPSIPGPIRARSATPVSLPVFRIRPARR